MSLLYPARLPIRRRNALIPLPLLPPVPRNTIVTSVRIVHNQCTTDTNFFDTSTVGQSPPIRAFSNTPSPPSPTATNLCFAPLNMGIATKRLRPGRRRSSCTPCQVPPCSQKPPPATHPPPPSKSPPGSVAVPRDNNGHSNDSGTGDSICVGPDPPPNSSQPQRPSPTTAAIPCDSEYDSSLLNPNRKPRSTIVVTVRSATPSDRSYEPRALNSLPASRGPPDRDAGSDGAGGILYTRGRRQPPDKRPGIDPTGRRRSPYRPPDDGRGDDDDGGTVRSSKFRRPPDEAIGVGGAWSALLVRRMAHKPRITSPLSLWVINADDDPNRMELDPWDVSPLSSPPASWSSSHAGPPVPPPAPPLPSTRRHLKRNGGATKKGKVRHRGRIGMLRWALLNDSGPEIGRRILAVGPHLAQEIWEAEQVAEAIEAESTEMEVTEQMQKQEPWRSAHPPPDRTEAIAEDMSQHGVGPPCERYKSTAVEHRHHQQHWSDVEPPDDPGALVEGNQGTDVRAPDRLENIVMEHKHGTDIEERSARERLADECIRELEEMEVDSEDIEMDTPPLIQDTAEKTAETPPIGNNNDGSISSSSSNNMDFDMPAPVAAVAPLSTARQVQIQLEIAVQVFSPVKKAQREVEKSKRWFERIAL